MLRENLLKLKKQGIGWAIKRIVREILQPSTKFGKWFRPLAIIVVPIISLTKLISSLFTGKKDKETLYLVYDLEVSPVTYDFSVALAAAEARRQKLGLKFLHVVIVSGCVDGLRHEDSHYNKVVTPEARWWRIHAVLISMTQFVRPMPSVSYFASRKQAAVFLKSAGFIYPDHYTISMPTAFGKKDVIGYPADFVKCFHAMPEARQYVQQWLAGFSSKKILVISLRAYGHVPRRNSKLDQWRKFIQQLDRSKYMVVIIPDNEQAMAPDQLNMPETAKMFTPACWNVGLRVALYEQAYLNLGVDSGPLNICWFNDNCRYIIFKFAPGGEVTELTKDHGVPIGESPFYMDKYQKWVWEDDDLPIIQREFDQMVEKIEAASKVAAQEPALALV